MLPVIVFVGFWVVVALGLFFVAIRGGLGGARAVFQTQTLTGRRVMGVLFAVIYVGFGVVLPIAFLTGNHANANAQVGGFKLTSAEKHGRELFGQHCAICHTLAGANADGKVGPNLDQLRLPYTVILHTIQNGCVQSPPPNSPQTCLGYGTMPASVVQGRDAQAVAAFVARVAGNE